MNWLKLGIVVFCLEVVFLSAGCNSEEPIESSVCTVSFENDIRFIFDTACAISGCHIADFPQGDFTSYEGIKTYVDNGKIWFRATVVRDMPPLNRLDEADIERIKTWIKEDAKDN